MQLEVIIVDLVACMHKILSLHTKKEKPNCRQLHLQSIAVCAVSLRGYAMNNMVMGAGHENCFVLSCFI